MHVCQGQSDTGLCGADLRTAATSTPALRDPAAASGNAAPATTRGRIADTGASRYNWVIQSGNQYQRNNFGHAR